MASVKHIDSDAAVKWVLTPLQARHSETSRFFRCRNHLQMGAQ